MAAEEVRAGEALFHRLQPAAEHVGLEVALVVGVPHLDVVVVRLHVVEVRAGDGELEDAVVVEEGEFLVRGAFVGGFFRHDVLHVHQPDGPVLVDDGEEHARDEEGDAQAHERVHEGVQEDDEPVLVLGLGDGHREDGVQGGDQEDFRQAPGRVAPVGHPQEVPGLVHHHAADDEDGQRKEGEDGGEAEEGAVPEAEPGVVGEGDAHEQENHREQGGESDRAQQLVAFPQVTGDVFLLTFFHCKEYKNTQKYRDFAPFFAISPQLRPHGAFFATFIS